MQIVIIILLILIILILIGIESISYKNAKIIIREITEIKYLIRKNSEEIKAEIIPDYNPIIERMKKIEDSTQ